MGQIFIVSTSNCTRCDIWKITSTHWQKTSSKKNIYDDGDEDDNAYGDDDEDQVTSSSNTTEVGHSDPWFPFTPLT